jgi:hypothetical protein
MTRAATRTKYFSFPLTESCHSTADDVEIVKHFVNVKDLYDCDSSILETIEGHLLGGW